MKKMVVLMLVLALAAIPVHAAVEFTASVSSGPRDQSVTRGLVDGQNARMEFVEGKAAAGMDKGGYMLTRDGGQTIYMVNPAEKSYMKINPEQLAASAGQLMNAAKGFMNMKFSNPKVETMVDEKGPELIGLPTRHVKTKTAYTVETIVFGSSSVSQVTREDDMWLTVKMNDPGFNLWLKQRNLKTGNPDVDKLIELESAKIKGFPMKIVSVSRTRDAKGREESTSTTYEITAVKNTAAQASAFAIPEGYKDAMAELGNEMRKARDGMKAEEAGEEGDETPAAVKGAVNSMMKGLFGSGR